MLGGWGLRHWAHCPRLSFDDQQPLLTGLFVGLLVNCWIVC
jgi:hypothetical protein